MGRPRTSWTGSGPHAHLSCMKTKATPAARLEPLLSINDLATYLGVPVATIYDWRVDGKGPCGIRVGRHVKFTVSDVMAWLEEQRETRPGGYHHGR
jgi:excisionase family DNA binding protein